MAFSEEFKDVLKRLNVIINIKSNHKIDFDNYYMCHKDSYYGAFWRTVKRWTNSEFPSNKETLNYIEKVFEDAIKILETLEDENHIKILINKFVDFKKSVNDMINNTYEKNIDFCSSARSCIESADIYIEKYKEYLIDEVCKKEEKKANKKEDEKEDYSSSDKSDYFPEEE